MERSHSREKWLHRDELLFPLFSCGFAPMAGCFLECCDNYEWWKFQEISHIAIWSERWGKQVSGAWRMRRTPRGRELERAGHNSQYDLCTSKCFMRMGDFYTHPPAANRAVRQRTWGDTKDLNNTINHLDLIYWILHSKTGRYTFFSPQVLREHWYKERSYVGPCNMFS